MFLKLIEIFLRSKLPEGYTDRFGEEVPAAEPDVVILDPPWAGCDRGLLEAAAGQDLLA